ncbi:MAG: Rieske 2Fe-2S domain-containing protein [Candidatus Binatia bacterium]|nr:Rieske 2Fe-2S domain-containing protein [Candidatus Binatia bacterium]
MADEARWASVPVAMPAEGRVSAFEVEGHELLLCNAGGEPSVITNQCPHAGVALAPGVLRGSVLECPFHGGKLDVRTGAPVAPPIRRPVRVFPVRQGDAGLLVQLDPVSGS